MQRMKRSAARDGAGAGGSNILRGGKNQYGSSALLGNWVEETAAAGIVKSSYTHPRFATTTRLSNEGGVGITGDKFGAGLVRPQEQKPADDAWATTTSTMQNGKADPYFSSSFRMTGGIGDREELEDYRKQWTSDTPVMRKTRFITEMNEALGRHIPQFKYRTLRKLPGQPRALELLRNRLVEGNGTFAIRQLRRALEARDADGLGQVTAEQFAAAIADAGGAAAEDVRICFDKKEVDGYCDIGAFMSAIAGEQTEARVAAVTAAWEALGGQPGGVGTVSVAQLGSVIGTLFDEQATEGDGVNFDEFTAAWADIGAAVVDDGEFTKLCGQ